MLVAIGARGVTIFSNGLIKDTITRGVFVLASRPGLTGLKEA